MRERGRFAKQKPLCDVAANGLQHLALLRRFHALNDKSNVELACELNGGFHNRMHHGVIELLGKLFVKFDDIKGQGVQTAQAGLTRTKSSITMRIPR